MERGPAFWLAIATLPEVEPHVLMGLSPELLAEYIQRPDVKPYAAELGGFLWRDLAAGQVWELHTMFRPEAWGRAVLLAARAVTHRMFDEGAQLLLTMEAEGWFRSRPPISHGWRPCGDFGDTQFGRMRTWRLSRIDWQERRKCP